jgi:hypothetical protein
MQVDQVIIAFFTGPLVVTKVFLGQRVVMIVQGQLQSIGQTSWASLGSLYYDKEKNPGVFEKRVTEVSKFLSALAVSLLIPTCLLNTVFLKLWVGPEYLMDTNALVYLSSGNAFFWSLFSFWGILFGVLGKAEKITRMVWFQAVINVSVSLFLTKSIGGLGPMAGTLFSNLMVPMWCFPYLLKKNFNISYRSTLYSLIVPGLIGITSLVIYHLLPWKFSNLGWLSFLGWGMFIFSSYVMLFYLFFFNKSERKIFTKRIQNLTSGLLARFS